MCLISDSLFNKVCDVTLIRLFSPHVVARCPVFCCSSGAGPWRRSRGHKGVRCGREEGEGKEKARVALGIFIGNIGECVYTDQTSTL